MNGFALSILTAVARYTQAKFVRKTSQTEAVQTQLLRDLLLAHQDTELGQKFGLSAIKTIEQFQQQVPILPYSSYEPLTERIAQGEPNILTAEPVVYLTLTSGSTGKKKLIPTTRRSQNIVRQATLTSMGFLSEALGAQNLKFGKLLVTNSTQLWGRTCGDIPYGPSSAGVLRMDKRLYKQFFAHPYETLQPANSLARHYVCLLFSLREPLMRGMVANFPMLILRTCNYLEKYAEYLLQDLETGTIAPWLELEPEIRANLEQQWTPAPRRAAKLRQILKSEGRLTPKLAWSNLSFVATARGGTSDFYFERFPTYFGDTPLWGAVYSSAEGMFSIYHDLNKDSSILAIESGFFEFIPEEQWEAEHPKTLLATDVKVGECYRILITTYGGFYRYDIGDVVEVLGFYNTAPLIVFRYRRGGFISSTTEKTTEFHVTQVMQALQQEFNVHLEDFCITLSEHDFPARYLVNIELASGQILLNSQAFLAQFDCRLQNVNTHYEISRRDVIPPPRLRILEQGSFAVLRQRQLQRGIPDSQLKFPHISEDRSFLAGLPVNMEVRLPEYADV
ncbi:MULTISPECIES: GH3 auxin-responsive promoter family protein [unclassified Coleofasciculus]|uniref:GH3 auxin-responsive promoter family protein n=1 Tax=unclassified Coleofasciculus TaxID=2692782 RepID=UPI00187F58E7|nr:MULTISPECIES: GH3 auxin-responsive promoter family protein [unclassified Coleofasciculus]MBE9125580.1 GH3 auxin-responsive promoter family protein [Coleofasciculus sp. LEGE 07081]MBE9147294.1 GH3 auxin-responsive promoter family protein [Coleofasciculus sp. LEGE 07092]